MDVNLELMAMRWLWLEKDCHYIVEQRSPRYLIGSPDVIGVTARRYLIEIEVKRSVSDFRADFKKRHRAAREHYLKYNPKEFYYMMPRALAVKLKEEIPEWAGLLCDPYDKNNFGEPLRMAVVRKKSPINYQSERLSLKECAKMCRLMANHTMVTKIQVDTHAQHFKNRNEMSYVDWVRADAGSYQI